MSFKLIQDSPRPDKTQMKAVRQWSASKGRPMAIGRSTGMGWVMFDPSDPSPMTDSLTDVIEVSAQ